MDKRFSGSGTMTQFLLKLLEGESGEGVIDLCLDHDLIRAERPEPFGQISGLDLFPDLEALSICKQEISHLKGMPSLPHLRSLNLSQNELGRVNLPALPALFELDLSLNELEGVPDLSAAPALKVLNLAFNELRKISPPLHSPGLKTLNLSGNNGLRSLSGIEGCAALEQLSLFNTRIRDLAPLRSLSSLKFLSLSPVSPQVLDQHDWERQPELAEIHFRLDRWTGSASLPPFIGARRAILERSNSLQEISGLEKWDKLKVLVLRKMSLKQLPDLSACRNLNCLKLDRTQIQQISPDHLPESLSEIHLLKNPMMEGELGRLQAARPALKVIYSTSSNSTGSAPKS